MLLNFAFNVLVKSVSVCCSINVIWNACVMYVIFYYIYAMSLTLTLFIMRLNASNLCRIFTSWNAVCFEYSYHSHHSRFYS